MLAIIGAPGQVLAYLADSTSFAKLQIPCGTVLGLTSLMFSSSSIFASHLLRPNPRRRRRVRDTRTIFVFFLSSSYFLLVFSSSIFYFSPSAAAIRGGATGDTPLLNLMLVFGRKRCEVTQGPVCGPTSISCFRRRVANVGQDLS